MKKIALLPVLWLLAVSAPADTLIVPDAFPSIQSALNAAASGDTVWVRAGTYMERVDFLQKAVSLIGVEGADATWIDGQGSGTVAVIADTQGGDARLQGFTLTQGFAEYGGGLGILRASPRIEENHFLLKEAVEGGGGIYCYGVCAPLVEKNRFTGNRVGNSGGGLICLNGPSPLIRNNFFQENHADWSGGGINCYQADSPWIEGNTFDLDFTTLIAAISQEPNFTGVEHLIEGRDWIKVDDKFRTVKDEQMFSGGDNINLGIAIEAIYHGRRAAYAIDEKITSASIPAEYGVDKHIVTNATMAMSYYKAQDRVSLKHVAVEERFKDLNLEITSTLTAEEAMAEAKRCMSCGKCFDCGTCWSLCQDNAIVKPLVKGQPYKVKMDFCNGCKKCAENCPCGYIEMH